MMYKQQSRVEKKEKIELEQEFREKNHFLRMVLGVCGGPLDVQNVADPPTSSFHVGCGC